MRKPDYSILALITLLFVVFVMGYFLGMNRRKTPVTVSVSQEIMKEPAETMVIETQEPEIETTISVILPVAINHAGKDTLTTLPGIGDVLAQRIIDYRNTHGNFTYVEDLLNVEGISKGRLDAIRDLIVIGG